MHNACDENKLRHARACANLISKQVANINANMHVGGGHRPVTGEGASTTLLFYTIVGGRNTSAEELGALSAQQATQRYPLSLTHTHSNNTRARGRGGCSLQLTLTLTLTLTLGTRGDTAAPPTRRKKKKINFTLVTATSELW